MKHVFGPIPSRRLGRSLGIGMVPLKTCNWSCVFCQLGRTEVLSNTRGNHAPAGEILAEVREVLAGPLGSQIEALLYAPAVREALLPADAVLPSLNADSETPHRRIQRPHASLTFERHLQGLVDFRRQYAGNLWVEVMLVRGLNDTEEALWDLAAALDHVQPDEVHELLPTRLTAEPWVSCPDPDALTRAQTILGSVDPVRGPASSLENHSEDLASAVLGIVSRHPMTERELVVYDRSWTLQEVLKVPAELQARGKLRLIDSGGKAFWAARACRYGSEVGTDEPTRPGRPGPPGPLDGREEGSP